MSRQPVAVRLFRGFALGGLVSAGLALLAMGATFLAGGPIGMLPGGELAGEPSEVPRGWAGLEDVREVQLQVRPDRPYSVTTWMVVHGGELYVSADFITPWKRWPHEAVRDPRVVLRIGRALYPRRAERVEDAFRTPVLREAFAEKYDLEPGGLADRSEVWFFRMAPPLKSR